MRELPYPDPPLADAAVRLRPWRESDVPRGLMAFADPVTERFSWPHSRPYTGADARAYFESQEAGRARGRQLELALVDPADDDVVLGCAALYDVDVAAGNAFVGYWLAAPARGRGVATRAVELLARWAFAELGLARLELTCGPDNHASQRVAERCGFTREALLLAHMPFKGSLRDTIRYARTRGDAGNEPPRRTSYPA
jgi:RimJ/RimL family protein N-acetyltransferase